MQFFEIEPEVSGGWGERIRVDTYTQPPTVSHVHYEFEGWMGSHLVTSHPVYLASDELVAALEAAGLTGFSTADAEVTVSEQARDLRGLHLDDLPRFRWLQVTGRPMVDDLGLDGRATLIASRRAVDVIEPLLGEEVFVEPADAVDP